MFGIGFGEMVVIAVLILLAVGPDKLPTMVKTVAKTYRQFRRTAQDIRASTGIDDLLRDEELRELAELRKQKLLAMTAKPAAAAKPIAKPAVAPPPAALAGPSAHVDEEGPIATTPAKNVARALTYKQRTIEAPLEGVDVLEAQHAASSKPPAEIPETRAGSIAEAKTMKANGGA